MDAQLDIATLLVLRKVTRGVAVALTRRLDEHLAALAPLLQPRTVLGQHLRGAEKTRVKDEDRAWALLCDAYGRLRGAGPYGRMPESLETPLDHFSGPLAITPVEYDHEAQSGGGTQRVRTTAPLRWILHYAGHEPERVREAITTPDTSGAQLRDLALPFLMLHVILAQRPALAGLLAALRFQVEAGTADELGGLPLAIVSAPVSTMLPPDEVIIQSTEISGTPAFQEVVRLDDVTDLRDGLKEELLEVVRAEGGERLLGGGAEGA